MFIGDSSRKTRRSAEMFQFLERYLKNLFAEAGNQNGGLAATAHRKWELCPIRQPMR
jgi:hypothetical protein